VEARPIRRTLQAAALMHRSSYRTYRRHVSCCPSTYRLLKTATNSVKGVPRRVTPCHTSQQLIASTQLTSAPYAELSPRALSARVLSLQPHPFPTTVLILAGRQPPLRALREPKPTHSLNSASMVFGAYTNTLDPRFLLFPSYATSKTSGDQQPTHSPLHSVCSCTPSHT
jgi:hypothetical protein